VRGGWRKEILLTRSFLSYRASNIPIAHRIVAFGVTSCVANVSHRCSFQSLLLLLLLVSNSRNYLPVKRLTETQREMEKEK